MGEQKPTRGEREVEEGDGLTRRGHESERAGGKARFKRERGGETDGWGRDDSEGEGERDADRGA